VLCKNVLFFDTLWSPNFLSCLYFFHAMLNYNTDNRYNYDILYYFEELGLSKSTWIQKKIQYCIPQFMHLLCQIHKKHYVATQRQLFIPLHFSNQNFRLDKVCILNVKNTFLTALGPFCIDNPKHTKNYRTTTWRTIAWTMIINKCHTRNIYISYSLYF
jgi:hypothetical protein